MNNLSHLRDDELLERLQAGDKLAYRVIYDRYWAILFRHARKMLQDDSEAQDTIQEIFTILWIKSNELSIQAPLGAYLYAAVRNKVLDYLKNKKVREKFIASMIYSGESANFITDSLIREKQLASEIEKEVAALPSKMRAVFELSRNEHLCHKQIADQLAISSKTVKKQISNALQILRGKLSAR